ncbi:zeta toxin family protein [Chamaesiphon polymorphus]|uniref:UDP-N-acetylglucosamine kinase n=1 Tax=Chamaesiphon polymorphus CCALA 037 TaxID=2107692 RepID=A0A2T1FBR3_9CYAN|nr:zeta toxin family protein [Chamaesiphon polymorphus]PSB42416.1 hypothetical protein C7B77_26730 [Chamaesiphon polymorphus CCALA 037]
MPELIVIAGSNGAGKSSLTKLFTADIPVIDPDAIAREIDPKRPESVTLAAGRQAIDRSRAYIQADCSFIVENTLAGNTYLNLIREVKALGWSVSDLSIAFARSGCGDVMTLYPPTCSLDAILTFISTFWHRN